MNLKEKIKSYSFWVSLASAVILILKVLGSRFGFSVDETMISDLFTALCSILVILGIIVVPGSKQSQIMGLFNEPEICEETKTNADEQVNQNNPVQEEPQVEVQQQIETQPQETENCFKEEPEQVISNEPIFEEQVTPETNEQTNVEQTTNDVFKSFLENEKARYSGNIEEFVNILQNEINSVKNNGEAQ